MAWNEVAKEDIYSKLEAGVNLAIAIFPNGVYNKTVEMSNSTQAGKIYELLQDEETVKFFEEV